MLEIVEVKHSESTQPDGVVPCDMHVSTCQTHVHIVLRAASMEEHLVWRRGVAHVARMSSSSSGKCGTSWCSTIVIVRCSVRDLQYWPSTSRLECIIDDPSPFITSRIGCAETLSERYMCSKWHLCAPGRHSAGCVGGVARLLNFTCVAVSRACESS